MTTLRGRRPPKRILQEANMGDRQSDLTMHVRAKGPSAIDKLANKYRCTTRRDCDYSSNRSGNEIRHKDSMHSQTTIECCGEKFSTKFNYETHRKLMNHAINGYDCNICGLKFKGSSQLEKHMLIHSGEKKFKCGIGKCKYTSNSKYNLLRHQRSSKHQKNDSFSTNALTHPQEQVSDILTLDLDSLLFFQIKPNELQTNENRFPPDSSLNTCSVKLPAFEDTFRKQTFHFRY